LMRTAKDAFLLKEWLAADADPRAPTDTSLADGVSCDEAGCVTPMAGGGVVALALRPEALADDCERAALVVTVRQAPPACGSAVMSGDRLRGQGATALRRTGAGFAVDAVRSRGVDRPWSPALRRWRQRWRRLHAPRGRWTRRRRKRISSRRIEADALCYSGARVSANPE
jgi:competence protein ComEC